MNSVHEMWRADQYRPLIKQAFYQLMPFWVNDQFS